MSNNRVLIDADELQALRVLAAKAILGSPTGTASETHQGGGGGATEVTGPDHSSDDLAPLFVGLDVQVEEPHPDWYALTLNSRSIMCRLAAAYPEHVPHPQLANRFRRTAWHPELEDEVAHCATHISHIRAILGADAVTTVYGTRVNHRGHVVRTGKSLGYRLGTRYVEWVMGGDSK